MVDWAVDCRHGMLFAYKPFTSLSQFFGFSVRSTRHNRCCTDRPVWELKDSVLCQDADACHSSSSRSNEGHLQITLFVYQRGINGRQTYISPGRLPPDNSPYGGFPARFCRHRTFPPALSVSVKFCASCTSNRYLSLIYMYVDFYCQSINQSFYIAQKHNVSNALKRRVNTERIKTFLSNVWKHQWKGWDF